MSPQISIVMPCLNQLAYLPEAVSSVLEQEEVDVELLVFDPGSTDGSRQWLRSEAQPRYGAKLRLFFESDDGQSDAINKGMSLARGSVLGWLNSDDRLLPGALRFAMSKLDPQRPMWLYGTASIIDGEGAPSSSFINSYKIFRSSKFSRFKLLQENFISQMAVFWTKHLWVECGGLDVNKHLDMDYDLWLRFSACTDPVVCMRTLANFRVHANAKGSLDTDRQLEAAYATARHHARGLGPKGSLALLIHKWLSYRTRVAYKLLKP